MIRHMMDHPPGGKAVSTAVKAVGALRKMPKGGKKWKRFPFG
jgi:hypothetical protein